MNNMEKRSKKNRLMPALITLMLLLSMIILPQSIVAQTPTTITNPDPAHEAPDVPVSTVLLTVTITDPEAGSTLEWTIETSPDVGSSSGTGESSGDKTCDISGLSGGTVYTWFVNATDGVDPPVSEIYTFSTTNNLPTSADNTVTTLEDTQYVFQTTDFIFNDVDGTTFQGIKVTILETVGDLKRDGNNVVANDEIPVVDIADGKLTFDPVAGGYGDDYDSYDFQVYDGIGYSTLSYTMTIDVTLVAPGVNDFGSTINDLTYDSDNYVEVIINTTGMQASTDYHLYKPKYNCTDSSEANLFQWENDVVRDEDNNVATFTTDADPTFKSKSLGYILLDRAGIWIVDDNNDHQGDDSSTFDAFFWVNTSADYTIDSIDDFKYGSNTTKTISVTEACWTDLIRPDSLTVRHKYASGGSTSFGTYGNITMAGNYTVRAYADVDLGPTYVYDYKDETNSLGVKTGYSSAYGSLFSSELNTILLGAGDHWVYSTLGPWDPPEINATKEIFRVETGETIASVPATANKTQYWNFSGQINISIDKDSSGLPMPADDYNVEVRNRNNENVTDKITISKAAGYCLLDGTNGIYGWGVDSDGNAYGTNGTWKIYIWSDLNGDRKLNGANAEWTEEWNKTITFKVIKASGTQFKWIDDDGSLSNDDSDGELPYIPAIDSADIPVNIRFQLIGSDHSYYGATSVKEAKENITITGNALFTGTLDTIPGVTYIGGTTWIVPIIPTMSNGGGTITITAVWEDYGSLMEKLDVGGGNYATNGTVVTVTPSEFTIDDDQDLVITVKDANGVPYAWADVYLYWIGDTHDGTPGTPVGGGTKWLKKLTGGTSDGIYTIGFNQSLQRENQTGTGTHAGGFTKVRTPRNLTVYVHTQNAGDGYARIQMNPKSNLKVTVEAVASPRTSTLLAGLEYSMLYFNFTAGGNVSNPVFPDEDDWADMTIAIYDENGDDKTDDIGSFTKDEILGRLGKGDYVADLSNEYVIESGTYTVYASNYTSDSIGNNGTLVVKQAKVEVDKSPLIWSYDDNISVTFTVTDEITGDPLSGGLIIDNISWEDATYNKTWVNTSYTGSAFPSDAGLELGETEGFINGTVTVHDITANYLPLGDAYADITFWFKPEDADGNLCEWARAKGILGVEVPTVSPDPEYIPLGRTTKVYCTATGRGETLSDVFIRLHGQGFDQNSTTDVDGRVVFSVTPASTGNISIDVGETGRTLPDIVVYVVAWIFDVDVVAEVDEGEQFTVTVTKEGTTDVVVDATVTIKGIGTAITDVNGEVTFVAPDVTSDRTYTIKVTAEGYAPDPDTNTITVINTPRLIIVLPDKVQATTTFNVAVADDTGGPIIGVIITFNEKTYTTGVNGIAKLTAPKTKGDYPITATFGNYVAATDIVTVTVAPGIPGFELLTLVAALGVAFILFRRRRR